MLHVVSFHKHRYEYFPIKKKMNITLDCFSVLHVGIYFFLPNCALSIITYLIIILRIDVELRIFKY